MPKENKREQVTYHVVSSPGGGWKVKVEHTFTTKTKQEAINRAKDLAKRQGCGQVVVHTEAGHFTLQDWTHGKDPLPLVDDTAEIRPTSSHQEDQQFMEITAQIDAVYDEIRGIVASRKGDTDLKEAIAPLRRKLEELQERQADVMEPSVLEPTPVRSSRGSTDHQPRQEDAWQAMKILPPVTHPWSEKIVRRHIPRALKGSKGYQAYRPCLRWEFGFSCAFCLVHEVDLAPYPIAGSGLTQVEHFIPKSRDETRRNIYENLFYVCRFCNLSRGAAMNEDAKGRLINPCDRAWYEVFVISGDRVRLRDKRDSDAAYTLNTYRLNEAPKVTMRKLRRQAISQHLNALEEARNLERDLLDLAEAGGGVDAIRMAMTISKLRWNAYVDLLKFRAIPKGYDTSCRCGHARHHSLPAVLEEQTIDISSLNPAGEGWLQI